MKKYYIILSLCFASVAGFSQSQNNASAITRNNILETAKDPKTVENAAKADVTLTDKKAVTKEKRKKPRREKVHKECSRMKS